MDGSKKRNSIFASIEKRNGDTLKENNREAQKMEEIRWLTLTVVCGKAVEFVKIEKNLPCPAWARPYPQC